MCKMKLLFKYNGIACRQVVCRTDEWEKITYPIQWQVISSSLPIMWMTLVAIENDIILFTLQWCVWQSLERQREREKEHYNGNRYYYYYPTENIICCIWKGIIILIYRHMKMVQARWWWCQWMRWQCKRYEWMSSLLCISLRAIKSIKSNI